MRHALAEGEIPIVARVEMHDVLSALRSMRSASGNVRRAPHADRSLKLLGKHAAGGHPTDGTWLPFSRSCSAQVPRFLTGSTYAPDGAG
jgi:hypothetical protein